MPLILNGVNPSYVLSKYIFALDGEESNEMEPVGVGIGVVGVGVGVVGTGVGVVGIGVGVVGMGVGVGVTSARGSEDVNTPSGPV